MNASPAMLSTAIAPTNRDEHWKYANLRALTRLRKDVAPAPGADLLARVAEMLPPALPDTPRIVLVDGYHIAGLSSGLPEVQSRAGGIVDSVDDLVMERAGGYRVDRYFAEVNGRSRAATLVVELAPLAKLRVEILCVAITDCHPALSLKLADDARLALIERHLSLDTGATAITNLHWSGRLGARATLEAARIGHHGARTHYLDTLDLTLGADSTATVVQVTEGAASTRSSAFIRHVGRNSSLHWHGASLGEGPQVHDGFVHVAHSAPGARTTQVFRGIAAGRSRVAFNGHMRVDADAVGTATAQSLKALIAGAEAEADARPQLEILTDAVTASHGATVGKLDADMLFYLLSRGIPAEAAESLLKWAFVSDVLAKLPCATLRAQVEATLERQLPGAAAARAGM